ncbi:MAG: flagellar basal-body rod protein FlgF [Elsteraceae bacterium]
MENPTYIALSRARTISRDMTSVANNIANASTNGFRAERTLFQEHLAKTGPVGQRERISFVDDIGLYRDTREGPLEVTNNNLDLAVRGDGYLVVRTPGQDMYTRSGRFQIDAERQLVTADGYPVVGVNDAPITLQAGADVNSVRIQGDGAITTNIGPVGQIQLVQFADEQALRKAGNGMYSTDQAALPSSRASLLQGSLEGSNVQPVMEMTRMMEMLRDYQSAQKLVDSEHERQRTAISRLSKTTS